MNPLLIDVPERIETERLLLRCPQPGDGPALNAAVRGGWRFAWMRATREACASPSGLGSPSRVCCGRTRSPRAASPVTRASSRGCVASKRSTRANV